MAAVSNTDTPHPGGCPQTTAACTSSSPPKSHPDRGQGPVGRLRALLLTVCLGSLVATPLLNATPMTFAVLVGVNTTEASPSGSDLELADLSFPANDTVRLARQLALFIPPENIYVLADLTQAAQDELSTFATYSGRPTFPVLNAVSKRSSPAH